MGVARNKVVSTRGGVTKKLAGDSQLVVALVLIAVAVGLCIIFRNSIYNIMQNLIQTISSAINQLAAGTVQGTT